MKSEGVFEDGERRIATASVRTGFAMTGGFYMGRGGRMNVGGGMKKERTVLSAPTGF